MSRLARLRADPDKVRVSIVLAEDERALGESLRAETRESLSALIGRLIREEASTSQETRNRQRGSPMIGWR